MDNFMDKLAKRFNAGEMIKANAQAEARDMKRLQERAAEYEHMMQEMRRLNLKNVEMTEQVQQLIQCGIEQFEGYGHTDALIGAKFEELQKELESMKAEATDNGGDIDRLYADLHADANSLSVRMDDLRTGISGIDAGVNGLQSNISGVENRLYGIESNIRDMDSVLKEGLNQGIDEEALAPIIQNIQMIAGEMEAVKAAIADSNKHLEEHVHKENVRVYRNVQAAVADETSKKSRELHSRIDQMEAEVKKTGSLRVMVLVAMLAAIGSVVLQILQMLQIL